MIKKLFEMAKELYNEIFVEHRHDLIHSVAEKQFKDTEKIFKFTSWMICLAAVDYACNKTNDWVLEIIGFILKIAMSCVISTYTLSAFTYAFKHVGKKEGKIYNYFCIFLCIIMFVLSYVVFPNYVSDKIVPELIKPDVSSVNSPTISWHI